MLDSFKFEKADDNRRDYPIDTTSTAINKAKGEGLLPVIPRDDMVMLDFDQPTPPDDLIDRLQMVDRFFNITRVTTTTSKSGNVHVYVWMLEPLHEVTRVALQAILGSDWKKEALSLGRLKTHGPGAVVLFEVPGVEHKEFTWR